MFDIPRQTRNDWVHYSYLRYVFLDFYIYYNNILRTSVLSCTPCFGILNSSTQTLPKIQKNPCLLCVYLLFSILSLYNSERLQFRNIIIPNYYLSEIILSISTVGQDNIHPLPLLHPTPSVSKFRAFSCLPSVGRLDQPWGQRASQISLPLSNAILTAMYAIMTANSYTSYQVLPSIIVSFSRTRSPAPVVPRRPKQIHSVFNVQLPKIAVTK